MSGSQVKLFNIPYIQYDSYWLHIVGGRDVLSPEVEGELKEIGYGRTVGGGLVVNTPGKWTELWQQTCAILEKAGISDMVEVALTAGADMPYPESGEHKKAATIQKIAGNLWLGEALCDDRVICYYQPVFGDKQKVFGFESFARVRMDDGAIIGGDKVVNASKALNIEYMLDRHLHVEAVKTFAGSDCSGFLFINVFPGFIHRPSVYLEGLNEAVKNYGIISKNLVLEFTRSETARDMKHLKNVCDYARSQGYSIAVDDITTVENAKKLVAEIRPDFVKIDSQALGALELSPVRNSIIQILDMVHSVGSSVIAEGVETKEAYSQLKILGVDLFQGYYFSPPAPIDKF